MPFLPIAERELRVAARRRATYRTRFWAVFITLIAFTWQFLWLTRGNIPSTLHGRMLFSEISGMAFVYCLFIGARATSDCLSEEKREGTLGLLFLTDLRGYDVVLGKLVSSSLNAVYGLLAIFPLLGICLMLGGVSLSQFVKTTLALVTTLLFSLAVGIFVSNYNRLERIAMFFTILLILIVVFAPLLFYALGTSSTGLVEQDLWPVLIGPGFMFILAMESGTSGLFPFAAFWACFLFTWFLTLAFLWRASLKVPHSWQEKEPNSRASRAKRSRFLPTVRVPDEIFRAEALDVNPFLWLALRGREKIKNARGFVGAMILIWVLGFLGAGRVMWDYDLLFPTILFINAFLKVWVTSEACTRLVEDRRTGALELLLSTPLEVEEIIRGQHLALRRQFAAPFLLLMFLEILSFLFGTAGHEANWTKKLFLPFAVILFAADFFTLRWVAMWIGLNSRSINRAILKVIMLVLILPWLIFGAFKTIISFAPLNPPDSNAIQLATSSSWVVIALLTNLVLYRWAKPNLLTRFRLLANQPLPVSK
ncbi:MAG: ABC transporter permease [Verrucomicrobiota bacterium]